METSAYLNAKLRNAETVEALGMLGNLRRLWLQLHEREATRQADAFEMTPPHAGRLTKVPAVYSQQSVMLAIGALLAIDGQ